MKPFLMGTETEYAALRTHPQRGDLGGGGVPLPQRGHAPGAALAAGRDRGLGGIFRARRAGLLDSGGHPEHATPECATPTQVALYDKAGERLFDLARERAQRDHPGLTTSAWSRTTSPRSTATTPPGVATSRTPPGSAATRRPSSLCRTSSAGSSTRVPAAFRHGPAARASSCRSAPATCARSSAPTRRATAPSSAPACARRRTTAPAPGRGPT